MPIVLGCSTKLAFTRSITPKKKTLKKLSHFSKTCRKLSFQRRYTSGRNSNKLIVNHVKLTRISKIAQAIYHLVNGGLA